MGNKVNFPVPPDNSVESIRTAFQQMGRLIANAGTAGGTAATIQPSAAAGLSTAQAQTGKQGIAATITVGTVTTGDPGTTASVTNEGSSIAAILDFVIPRGDTGATGATGATGPIGATGATGATGTAGTTDFNSLSNLPNGPGNEIYATPNGATGTAVIRSMVLADLPPIGASTVLGNATTGTAVPAALTVAQTQTLLGLGSAAYTNSTAYLAISGGTLTGNLTLVASTASVASLVIPLGSAAYTGTTAGAFWYDYTSHSLKQYTSGIASYLHGTLFSSTATVTTSGTGASSWIGTGVGSVSLPANFFVAGKTVRIKAYGTVTTGSSPGTVTLTLALGAVTVNASAAVTPTVSLTTVPFMLDAVITARSTTSVYGFGKVTYGTGTDYSIGLTTTAGATIATGTAYTLAFTSTNSSSSGCVWTVQNLTLECLT